MGLGLELTRSAVFLFLCPVSLIKTACFLGIRAVCSAVSIWMQMMKFFINFLAEVCWKMVVLSLACVTFPVRVLTAVQRERMLELNNYNLRTNIDNLIWEKKQLEERLHVAIKDRKVVETVFAEIEDEYDKAITQIERLEDELRELEADNRRLKEVHDKGRWDYKGGRKDCENVREGIPVATKYPFPSWATAYDHAGAILHGIYDHGTTLANRKNVVSQPQDSVKSASIPSTVYSSHRTPTDAVTLEEAVLQRRFTALSQSLFSAVLSLVVGAIIFEAEDPCMPLIAALFTVAGMSLSSVFQFLSTISNKPASDAIALLSLNWFVLGTLTSPALPHMARAVYPPAVRLLSRALGWAVFSH